MLDLKKLKIGDIVKDIYFNSIVKIIKILNRKEGWFCECKVIILVDSDERIKASRRNGNPYKYYINEDDVLFNEYDTPLYKALEGISTKVSKGK